MMEGSSRILLTRPEPECGIWTAAMREQGLSAFSLPLIDIAPVPFVRDAAWPIDAWVFVSRSAVDGFFQTQTSASLQAARCLSTGLGTRAALIQKGVQADLIDAPDATASQFDSEALWQVIGQRDWAGKRVCIVRGSNYLGQLEGRSWLERKLTEVGAFVQSVCVYQRRLPLLSEGARAIFESPLPSDIWVFSSSQAIEHLKLLLPSRDWSQNRAIATHDRIFITAKGAGFGRVTTARPVLADVAACCKALVNLA